jgi:hypothetical protein
VAIVFDKEVKTGEKRVRSIACTGIFYKKRGSNIMFEVKSGFIRTSGYLKKN